MTDLLDKEYPRGLFGFDLRLVDDLQIFSKDSTNLMTASLSPYVWQTAFPESWECYQHELGLFSEYLDVFVNRHQINNFVLDNNVVEVAFDIPVEILKNLILYYEVQAISLELICSSDDWLFLGFDVVDPTTLMSGLNTKFKELLASQLSEKEFIKQLNRFRLFGKVDAAISTSLFLNDLVPEHSPFVPCGVWVKIDRTVKFHTYSISQ